MEERIEVEVEAAGDVDVNVNGPSASVVAVGSRMKKMMMRAYRCRMADMQRTASKAGETRVDCDAFLVHCCDVAHCARSVHVHWRCSDHCHCRIHSYARQDSRPYRAHYCFEISLHAPRIYTSEVISVKLKRGCGAKSIPWGNVDRKLVWFTHASEASLLPRDDS